MRTQKIINGQLECSKCGVLKNLDNFPNSKKTKSGHTNICSICNNKRGLDHYYKNRLVILNRQYNRYHNDEEFKKKHSLSCVNITRERKKYDINFKLSLNLRASLRQRLKRDKGKRNIGKTIKMIGCTLNELKIYLESKFQPGMTWDNWGVNGWHIDHIKPLSSFDLTDETQFKEANHYTNLQPLWAKDNLRKYNKYEQ